MATDDQSQTQTVQLYGYVPTEWICILFLVLYIITTVTHFGQALVSRRWYLLCTVVICGIAEILGWSGRLWSNINQNALTPFLMQISTTIFAPTFLTAANFIILGQIINRLPEGARGILSPKAYAILFITIDVVALVIQAAGGGIASSGASDTASNGPDDSAVKGGHIMLAGIVIQLVAMIIYIALAAIMLVQSHKYNVAHARNSPQFEKPKLEAGPSSDSDSSVPQSTSSEKGLIPEGVQPSPNNVAGTGSVWTPKLKLMLAALIISTGFLFVRSVYRTIELSKGWTGPVINTQWYFNVFDGAMVTLAMYILNVLHPNYLL